MAMEQRWIDDLNGRFPGIGDEFQQAVQKQLARSRESVSLEERIRQLTSHPDYDPQSITNTAAFGLHSELLVLYPALGKYQDALQEAKLLRDFVIANPPDTPDVIVTFRGVYTELLIVNEHYEQALEECHATLEIAPEGEGVYLSQGVIYTHLGNLEQAFESLKTLIELPDPEAYAQELFAFILTNRSQFQRTQIQADTLIDVILSNMQPRRPTPIVIPIKNPSPTTTPLESPLPTASPLKSPSPTATPQSAPMLPPIPTLPSMPGPPPIPVSAESQVTPMPSPEPVPTTIAEPIAPDPLAALIVLDEKDLRQALGSPIAEIDDDETLMQDYAYNGYTLTLHRDKERLDIVSLSMFFLPPVQESEAFTNMGLHWRDIPPDLQTQSVKVWTPYGPFAKARISLNENDVIAITVYP
jgi:tetratricopeptide (TPR) repeat protein